MRLDPVLDSFYALGSLWGVLTGPPVCPARPAGVSEAARVAARAAAPTAASAVTAFVDVNVVPMDTERVLPNQTVLVEGGRITALGPTAKVTVPAGAVRIDGRDKYLIPGFAEMHGGGLSAGNAAAGQEVYNLLFELGSGVTAIRIDGHVGSARIFEHAKPAEAHWRPYFYLAGTLEPPVPPPGMTAESAAAAYKAAGYHYTLNNYMYNRYKNGAAPDSLLAAARRHGLPLVTHDHDNVYSPRDLQAHGAYGGAIEHLYWFYGPNGTDRSAADIPAAVAAAQRAGIWTTPTMKCLEGKYRGQPHVVELSRQLVKALQDAGVGLLLGTDNESALDELAALVRAGLSPYQALLTGTRNVAQFLGLHAERGTVAVGKRADLVLLHGNPLADIRHTRERAGVMLNGRWFDRAALEQRLLADPKQWWFTSFASYGFHARGKFDTLEALTDSLAVAKAVGSEGKRAYRRVLGRLADDLGTLRASLTPEQRETFDPAARAWLRAQARQGYQVAVTGVTPEP
jgi:imidazolonepropionase-like amidohydrolase